MRTAPSTWLALLLLALLADATPAASPRDDFQLRITPGRSDPRRPAPRARSGSTRAASPAPGHAAGLVTSVPCPEPQASCGYVSVPYDRHHPERGTIGIYFERYGHTAPGPAVSAIVMNLGGPGGGTTIARDYAQRLFAPDLDVHDLLLIDDRGRGLSNTIDCAELQQGTASIAKASADCAAQLGAGETLYGTADIAADTDAVRAALGYRLLDYYGASYGGADALAYASRYPSHVRSLVLDAPVGPPMLEAFEHIRQQVRSLGPVIATVCRRSVLCSADHMEPLEELDDLVQRIRARPIEGDSHDAFGNPVHIKVDESALLNFVFSTDYFTQGEVLAANRALEHGDPAPLLRIGAEQAYTMDFTVDNFGPVGDPTVFSQGAHFATSCVDTREPWDWKSSIPARRAQYAAAALELDADYFEPFSAAAATSELFNPSVNFGPACAWWQKPVPVAPVIAPGARFAAIPTVVMVGELDDIVPYAASRAVAELIPHSTFEVIAGAGHEAVGWSPCAAALLVKLIETLRTDGLRCSDPTVAWIYPAVGRFPLYARDARPLQVDPAGNNHVDVGGRRVAGVAVATALDAVRRAAITRGATAGSTGLRGGSFSVSYPSSGDWVFTLAGCRLAGDVIVSGTATWFADNSVAADLAVTGPDGLAGTLHVSGAYFVSGAAPGNFHISGQLGGKTLALLLPEA